MEEITLVGYYRQNQADLKRKLQSADTIANISKIVQDELKRLSDAKGEYISNLTPPQARVALSMLEAFRLSFSMLATVQIQTPESVPHETDTTRSVEDSPIPTIDGTLGGLAGGAVGGAISGGMTGGAVGAALGAVVAIMVRKIASTSAKSSRENGDDRYPPSPQEKNTASMSMDTKELLDYLERTLNVIDSTVAEYSHLTEPVKTKPKLEDHPEVLEFMQNLMGEALTLETPLPAIIQSRIKEVPSILRKYGIRAQGYQNKASDTARGLFEFEPSIDPNLQNSVMVKPALIKGDEILLRGRVIEPSTLREGKDDA
ncbi:MAG TPA: hypothetical protein PKV33_03075 [Methanothrix sp.]|nr:hypothetical protein [Methanothrix sp.]